MNKNADHGNDRLPEVKIVSPPESVPVYNCIVYLKNREDGVSVGEIVNLDPSKEITTRFEGPSERDILRQAVASFKSTLAEFAGQNQDMNR